MAKHFDADTLQQEINEKLKAYSRQAGSYRRLGERGSTARLIRTGSLTAVIPLVTTLGDARAQCSPGFLTSSGPPYGTVVLDDREPSVTIPLGTIGEYARIYRTPYVLVLDLPRHLGASVERAYLVLNFPGSSYNYGAGPAVSNGLLCDRTGSYPDYAFTLGNFCPANGDSAGYVRFHGGTRGTTWGRTGWLALEVVELDPDSATLVIGKRGMSSRSDERIHTGPCSSLPVELTSFDAVRTNNAVVLSWETASELNNAGFELERAEKNATFRKLTFVEGHGNTTDPCTYAFADDSVEPNAHYRYRLKQIDFDGTSSFSKLVEVFTEDPSQIALSDFYPNPSWNGRATLHINVASDIEATIDVYDVRGILVDSRSRVLSAGQNQLAFRTDDLAAGAHFAKVQIGEKVLYRQIVVAR